MHADFILINCEFNHAECVVENSELVNEILSLYGDKDSRKIMNYFTEHNCQIEEAIENTNIPPTSAYRKINKMIKNGIIIKSGYKLSTNRRKIKTYTTFFESLSLGIKKSIITISFVPKNKMTMQMN